MLARWVVEEAIANVAAVNDAEGRQKEIEADLVVFRDRLFEEDKEIQALCDVAEEDVQSGKVRVAGFPSEWFEPY